LADAVLVLDVVATELVGIHLVPLVLPSELLSNHTHIHPQNNDASASGKSNDLDNVRRE